jgi:Acetyltransferase (GNAT) domain
VNQSGPPIVVRSIQNLTDVPAAEWDAICGPDDWFTHSYLTALHRSDLACRFVYFVAYRGSRAVGLSFGAFVSYPLALGFSVPVFTLGTPVNLGLPFACVPAERCEEVFAALCQAAHEEAQRRGGAGRTLPPSEISFRSSPTCSRSPPPSAPAGAWTSIPAPCWTFGGRSSRTTSLRAGWASASATPGTRSSSLTRAAPLRSTLARRPQVPCWTRRSSCTCGTRCSFGRTIAIRFRSPLGYFAELVRHESSLFFLLRKASRTVAFYYVLRRGRRLDSIFCGHEAAPVQGMSYNRVLGYELVRWAIANGFTLFNFGISNEDTKKAMGCRMVPVRMVLLATGPVLKTAFRLLPPQRERLPRVLHEVPPKPPPAKPRMRVIVQADLSVRSPGGPGRAETSGGRAGGLHVR